MAKGAWLFFDVETPNKRNDKICSIGLRHFVPGQAPYDFGALVNPETGFAALNTSIHGISE